MKFEEKNKLYKIFNKLTSPRHHILKNKREQMLKRGWPETDLDISDREIKVGDIIWAKRYNNEEEKEFIPLGHREGPFIVLKKRNKDLICSFGTSVDPAKYNRENYFTLDAVKDYNIHKVTYFNYNKVQTINNYSFIRQIDELKVVDKERLFKDIKLANREYYANNRRVDLNLPLSNGDIINVNEINYIVIDITETSMVCMPIYKDYKSLNLKDIVNLDYSRVVTLDIKTKYQYLNTLSNDLFKILLKSQKEYIDYCIKEKYPKRGSVILKDNKYFYIFGEEGQYWLIFEIFSNENSKQSCITIKGNDFYTEYKGYKLNKKENFDILLLAKDDEMDKIKESKKNFSKKSNKNSKKSRR